MHALHYTMCQASTCTQELQNTRITVHLHCCQWRRIKSCSVDLQLCIICAWVKEVLRPILKVSLTTMQIDNHLANNGNDDDAILEYVKDNIIHFQYQT